MTTLIISSAVKESERSSRSQYVVSNSGSAHSLGFQPFDISEVSSQDLQRATFKDEAIDLIKQIKPG